MHSLSTVLHINRGDVRVQTDILLSQILYTLSGYEIGSSLV